MVATSLAVHEGLNINISAYRVLYILLMLVRYRGLNLLELNRHLNDNEIIGRAYNAETLSKYINTLREVGCDIPKATNRNDFTYDLMKNPFPMTLDDEETAVAGRLLSLLQEQPDDRLLQGYQDVLDALSWSVAPQSVKSDPRFVTDEGETLSPLETAPNLPLSALPSSLDAVENLTPSLPLSLVDSLELLEAIKPSSAQGTSFAANLVERRQTLRLYQRFCQEAYMLNFEYRDVNSYRTVQFEPLEVQLVGTKIFLSGIDCGNAESVQLDVSAIENPRQLPAKNRRTTTSGTVTFALYGRLANSYRLYPDERLIYQSATEIQVKTRLCDPEVLLSRLLKYGSACQILTPISLRAAMKTRITEMLQPV